MSVGLSVCLSVPPLRFWRFRHFASGFFITAPAQAYETDAVVYMGPPIAPALHFTAPAQHPRLQPVRVSGLVLPWSQSALHRQALSRGGKGMCGMVLPLLDVIFFCMEEEKCLEQSIKKRPYLARPSGYLFSSFLVVCIQV